MTRHTALALILRCDINRTLMASALAGGPGMTAADEIATHSLATAAAVEDALGYGRGTDDEQEFDS